jgi:hypothetical protein
VFWLSLHSLLSQNYRSKPKLALSEEAFLRLLKICAVPPVYLEVLLNNNGAYSSLVTYSPGSKAPKDFCERVIDVLPSY